MNLKFGETRHLPQGTQPVGEVKTTNRSDSKTHFVIFRKHKWFLEVGIRALGVESDGGETRDSRDLFLQGL